MMPFIASKFPSYAKIGFMYLGFYALGQSYVMGQFGDRQQFNYLCFNKSAIVNGTKGWDKQWLGYLFINAYNTIIFKLK